MYPLSPPKIPHLKKSGKYDIREGSRQYYRLKPMVINSGLEPGFLNRKKKQRSFRESPLSNNGTLKILLCQDPIYGQGGKI